MLLTKTDFIHFLKCPKSFWVFKKEKESYPNGNFSLFLQKITREGREVEEYLREYFSNEHRSVSFQKKFTTPDGLFARTDALEKTQTGKTYLYEVKSSTRLKTDSKNNHLKDACFQKVCAERTGQKIDRVFIVHLNGNYIRQGKINPAQMLTFVDVTDQVEAIHKETSDEIEQALTFLKEVKINRKGCPCLNKSRANHCDTFSMFNPHVPENSIYNLPRLSDKLRSKLVSNGIFSLLDVPEGYPITEAQRLVIQAAKSGKPQINRTEIKSYVSKF